MDQCLILTYSDHRNSATISDLIRTIIGTMGVEESRFRRKLLRVSHGQESKVSTKHGHQLLVRCIHEVKRSAVLTTVAGSYEKGLAARRKVNQQASV